MLDELAWRTVSVAEAIKKQRGKEVRKLQTAAYQKSGVLPIVDQGAALVCGFTDDASFEYPYELPVIVFGDHTRSLKYIDFPFAVGADGTQCLRPSDDFDPRYFFYALGALDLPSEGYARHFKLLKERHIPVPKLDEQRRIAEVLRSADDAVRAALATIAQTELVHMGLLDTLMTAVPEGTGDEWREVSLGELVADPITYGVVQPGDYLDEGVILVRGGDFPNGQIRIDGLPRISPDVARPYDRSTLKGGDILISLVGYPGACAIVPMTLSGANISRSAALVRPGKEIDRDFLYHFIRSSLGQRRVLLNSIGSAQQVVNLKELREVIVPIPPRERQEEIASILNVSMRNVLLATQYLKELKSLKTSIASDLLSGRVRVPA